MRLTLFKLKQTVKQLLDLDQWAVPPQKLSLVFQITSRMKAGCKVSAEKERIFEKVVFKKGQKNIKSGERKSFLPCIGSDSTKMLLGMHYMYLLNTMALLLHHKVMEKAP